MQEPDELDPSYFGTIRHAAIRFSELIGRSASNLGRDERWAAVLVAYSDHALPATITLPKWLRAGFCFQSIRV
jgi:hypothetical protein